MDERYAAFDEGQRIDLFELAECVTESSAVLVTNEKPVDVELAAPQNQRARQFARRRDASDLTGNDDHREQSERLAIRFEIVDDLVLDRREISTMDDVAVPSGSEFRSCGSHFGDKS